MSDTGARNAAVIGGGPAGLMAAERLAGAGIAVTVYDRMPSLGRKLLIAGRGGLNLTHSEDLDLFLSRYGGAEPIRDAVRAFPPAALVGWCEGLGEPTFVGSSGRVFPVSFKASPLLRAWLLRLAALGVRIVPRHRFEGWDEHGRLVFAGPGGEALTVAPDATLLAMGGASWPRLGSDGLWQEPLAAQGIAVRPFRPSNCGFAVAWSEPFRSRFAGTALKRIALSHGARRVPGEAMITHEGIEGGAVYALSAALRDAIARDGRTVVVADLRPDLSAERLRERLAAPQGKQSLSTFLRKRAGLPPVAIALLREGGAASAGTDAAAWAARIKAVPVTLEAVAPMARAISTAGGIALEELDSGLMLRRHPGLFAAGEMLDWEAPTGGYLIQASMATGAAAASGMIAYLAGA